MRALYRPSPRRRRAQLGGAVALCALATGSTGALLIVANAGVDLVRITPAAPGSAAPARAERIPAGEAGSAAPSREPAFGWSERGPYVAPSPSPTPSPSETWFEPSPTEPWSTEYFETPGPDESGEASSQTVPASPGEGLDRSEDASPAVGVVKVTP